MAKQTKQNVNLVVNQIKVIQLQKQQIAIDKWRTALQSAENVRNPLRRQLLEIYKELMLDAHTYAIVDKRIRAVTRQKFRYVEDNKDTTEINKAFESPWFQKTIRHIMEARFWGFSLIEFPVENGLISHAKLIPRQNCRPELGIVVLTNSSENTGIEYRLEPYNRYVLEVYLEDELGLLNIAACNVILKRGGTVDYANFIEMFGAPIRQYEYDPSVPGAREETEKVAQDSGNSAAIVTPRDWTTLTLHQSSQSGTNPVHHTFIQDLKEELSILILGNSMTTQNGSSRSQAEVHQDEQDNMTQDDRQFVEQVLNFDLKPKLEALGYPVGSGMFRPDDTDNIPIDIQLQMDLQIKAAGIAIDDDYFYEKYKIPKPKGTQAKPKPEKKKLTLALTLDHRDCGCGQLHFTHPPELALFDSILKLFRKVFKGDLKSGELDEKTFTDTYKALVDGIQKGYENIRTEYEQPDTVMLDKLKNSTTIFAAHKNSVFISALVDALQDADGNLQSWANFKATAQQIHQGYNVQYLQAEYNQAVAAAQAARKWVEIQANKDVLPNLKYVTVGDNNVRPAHQALEGIVKPVDDPFWQKYYPPNGWGCRCTVQQVDGEAEITPDTDIRKALKAEQIDNQWQENVGISGKPFGSSYEYYLSLTSEQRKAAEKQAKKFLDGN